MSTSLGPHGLPGSSVHWDSSGKNAGVGCHAIFQGIFPTRGSNPGLPICRQILYHLSHQGSLTSNCTTTLILSKTKSLMLVLQSIFLCVLFQRMEACFIQANSMETLRSTEHLNHEYSCRSPGWHIPIQHS